MPSEDRDAMVGNTQSQKQLRKASQAEMLNDINYRKDLGEIMSTPGGRRFMWKLLGRARVFESIWHPSALIHYNSGQQDIGHQYQAEMVKFFPKQYFLMIEENSNG